MSEENIPGKGETTITKPRTVDGIFRVVRKISLLFQLKAMI